MTLIAQSWLFWAVLAAIFAAGTALTAKVGVTGIDSDLATWIRTMVVAVVLAALLLVSGKGIALRGIAPRTWIYLVLSGLATGASWLCYFRALQLGQAGQVAPVDKLSVVFVAVLAALFLGETLSPIAWGGVGLIALGAVLVAVG